MESLDFVFLVRSEPLWPNAIYPVRTRSVHGLPGSAGVRSFLTEGDGAQAVPAPDVLFVLGTVAYLWGLNRFARPSSRARQREACRRLCRNPHAAAPQLRRTALAGSASRATRRRWRRRRRGPKPPCTRMLRGASARCAEGGRGPAGPALHRLPARRGALTPRARVRRLSNLPWVRGYALSMASIGLLLPWAVLLSDPRAKVPTPHTAAPDGAARAVDRAVAPRGRERERARREGAGPGHGAAPLPPDGAARH
jgi:hypothetical protein